MSKDKNTDFAAVSKFKLTPERLDSYCHVVMEELACCNTDGVVLSKGSLMEMSPFDLSSFTPQKELNPKIWINNQLNSKVRLKLLDIADDFIDTLKVDWAKPIDIILTGSLANYNWSKYSDFDLHILMDFSEVDERTDFVKEYFNSKKKIWNDTHDELKIYGFPVELYVQDINEKHTASGIYSINKNKWIKEPEIDNFKSIHLDEPLIKAKSLKFAQAIENIEDACENNYDEYEIDALGNKAKKLFDKIKGIRKEALSNGNEMSTGNIIFKVLRRMGYIERLVDLKTKLYDKRNSIR